MQIGKAFKSRSLCMYDVTGLKEARQAESRRVIEQKSAFYVYYCISNTPMIVTVSLDLLGCPTLPLAPQISLTVMPPTCSLVRLLSSA